jgi:hypothetical protein
MTRPARTQAAQAQEQAARLRAQEAQLAAMRRQLEAMQARFETLDKTLLCPNSVTQVLCGFVLCMCGGTRSSVGAAAEQCDPCSMSLATCNALSFRVHQLHGWHMHGCAVVSCVSVPEALHASDCLLSTIPVEYTYNVYCKGC